MFKQALETKLTEITAELKTLGVHNPEVKEDWITTPESPVEGDPDPNVEADVSEEWIERRGILSQLETEYNDIVAALAKIEAGTYGYCEVCNTPIDEKRLEAYPAARTCSEHMNDTGTARSE